MPKSSPKKGTLLTTTAPATQTAQTEAVAFPDRMTREQTAAFLTSIGYPIAPKSLAMMASGTKPGPPYMMFYRRVLYDKADVVAWAETKLTAKASNTSEHADLARRAERRAERRAQA
jgi:hypothetical protein